MATVPFKVKAVFDYKSEEPDDLNFPNGQIISVKDDTDPDWYNGEYTSAAGDKLEGIFPRNFVEKYEPAIPSRPTRAPKKAAAPETLPEPAPVHDDPVAPQLPEPVKEAEIEPAQEASHSQQPASDLNAPASQPAAPQPRAAAAPKPTSPPPVTKSGPPPVAEKPSSNSFRDRIAAFNKPAAAPIAPFKPGGQGSSGFIKKPFVAPPPSKNAYVPPPREPPPQKTYRREEDPTLREEEEREAPSLPKPTNEDVDEDQPKPTSLKDRIALLQKQQLEQAARHAETVQKKEKPKKPPKKRVEPTEEVEPPTNEEHLERLDTNETVVKRSVGPTEEGIEPTKFPPARQASINQPTPLPPRELVSDTNDADDSGAGDTEDARGNSTEEDRPRSKGLGAVTNSEPPAPKAEPVQKTDDEETGEGEEEEEDEEEDEDPEVRRKRELRDRMAKMSGGMGMMGMFGPPGGMPAAGPPRKSRPSTEATRQSSEQQGQEDVARAPPVPIMALPGMSTSIPKRPEKPLEVESDDEENTESTPHDIRKDTEAREDYVSRPPKRSSTGQSSATLPQERAVPPPPPQREVRAPPPPPPAESRAVPPLPQSPTARAVPPPLPHKVTQEPANDSEDDENENIPPPRRSDEGPASPTGIPPLPPSKSRPDPIKPEAPPRDSLESPISSPQARPPPPPPPAHPARRPTGDSHSGLGVTAPVNEDSEDEVTEYDGDYDTDIASSAKHKDALKSHNRDSSIDDGIMTDDATKSPISPPARSVPPLPPVSAPREVPPPPPPSAPKSRKSVDVPRAPPPVPPPSQPDDGANEYDPYRYSGPQHGMPSPSLANRHLPILASPREEVEEPDMYGASTQSPRLPPPPPSERAAPPPPPPGSPLPEPPRRSTDAKNLPRRSTEQARTGGEQGFIAADLDLGRSSFWWTQEKLPPPILQHRSDLLYEIESSTSRNGSNSTVSKDVYVVYPDYSRTTINASFDASDPSHVTLEQSHERPPPPPRKDQLEAATDQFGSRIASAASSAEKAGSTYGDGSAQSFITELLKPLTSALQPIGTRAYGAPVYANLANASVQQFDEIRAGDIVTFRNAKFVGHKGNLHQKYSVDVGKPDHVGVVIDWDGTKKKIRAWEQVSREERGKKAKVKEESFKVGDLKSGEVRVWRVMGRGWVGWAEK